jgi:hypothetical protein
VPATAADRSTTGTPKRSDQDRGHTANASDSIGNSTVRPHCARHTAVAGTKPVSSAREYRNDIHRSAAKDRSTPDLAGDPLGDRRFRAWRMQLQCSMWPLPVLVHRILGEHAAQVPYAEDQHPSVPRLGGSTRGVRRSSSRPTAIENVFTVITWVITATTGERRQRNPASLPPPHRNVTWQPDCHLGGIIGHLGAVRSLG